MKTKTVKTVSRAGKTMSKTTPKAAARKVVAATTIPKKAAVAAPAAHPPKPKPVARAARPRPTPPSAGDEVLRELREIRSLLAGQKAAAPSADAVLEGGVDSLRRLLSEVIDKRTEWIAARLVALLDAAAGDAGRVQGEIERLLEDLGAIRFHAEARDHFDPLIYIVAEERPTPEGPESVILATVRPGYRFGTGSILAKARVAVSRRA